MPAKAFRIKRQAADGETLQAPAYNLCRCCGRPIDAPAAYCSPEHEAAHQRLTGCR